MLKELLQFFADEMNKYLMLKKILSPAPRLITASGIAVACHGETYTLPDPHNNIEKEEAIIKHRISIFNLSIINV